jgi:Domain of unknown function (DUF6438)
MRLTLILLTATLLLTACQHPHNTGIWKVEVGTTQCFGTCQKSVTIIDSNLSYHFYGGDVAKGGEYGRKGKIFGYYAAKITRKFWDSLTTKVEDIDYASLKSDFPPANDAPVVEILVFHGDQVKRVRGSEINMPDTVVKVIRWIAGSYATIKPAATTDTIKMEDKDWEAFSR